MTLPTFFVIGAGRSGTTSLADYLGQHPDVYMSPVKAPSHFFCADLERIPDRATRLVTRSYFTPDARRYESLFDGVRGERAVGEVSPVYLASVHVAQRIATRLPDARVIAVFRNPVDRAYARWVARSRDGLERRDFAQVVRDEREQPLVRDVAFHTYLSSGCCSHVLETYLEHFPREHIRVHLYEDLARDPVGVLQDLYAFLGVDGTFVADTERRLNRSGGTVENRLLRGMWTRTALARAALRPYLPRGARDRVFGLVTRTLVPRPLDPDLRAQLVELYRPEILRLGELLDRDLSSWLTTEPGGERVEHAA